MIDDILNPKGIENYFEDELSFIRHQSAEFAAKYKEVAAELMLEEDRCLDPHVERLLQGFALLTARIQKKLDDQFPELTEAFFHILYPHYLRPIPPMSIIEFELDPEQSSVTAGLRLPAGTRVFSSGIDGRRCEFRTGYPAKLWPLEVFAASIGRPAALGPLAGEAVAAIRLEIRPRGAVKLEELQLDTLRFFLKGEDKLTFPLHELIFNNTASIVVRTKPNGKPLILSASAIKAVGFGRDEELLPFDDRSFLGYRLIQEYFAFPWKFLFFDLEGLDRLPRLAGENCLEIAILLNSFERPERLPDLERDTGAHTFRLGCAPIVNLFKRLSEPITLSHTVSEYRVDPDQHNPLSTEVYSVDRVVSLPPSGREVKIFQPFYSVRHSYGGTRADAFWYASRRPALRKGFRKDDMGSEIYLSFVDLGFEPSAPTGEVVHAEITCTNRDLSDSIKHSGAWGEFETAAVGVRLRGLVRPTKTLRPPMGGARQWRLISHLTLNHLSLTGGIDPLREILSLYDFSQSAAGALSVRSQVAGLVSLKAQRVMERISGDFGVNFCQGLQLDLEIDEGPFIGAGCFPFLCVLERFFALYSAINSFTQLRVRSRQRKEVLRSWMPRAGEQLIL